MRIEAGGFVGNIAQSLQRQNSTVEQSPETLQEGLRVSLSQLGRELSAKPDGKHKDIDDSDLPDSIKTLLKMIRELKLQIAIKLAELQELTADQSLDPEQKNARLQALRAELGGLNSALTSASNNLARLMRDQGLSSEQMQAAATLALG
ncbi:hypothetical protein CK507_09625 [Pseudomonas sp. WN033]|nr:hypothetical protein CK507_09625 [Pseudomonas sp. WN033]